MEESKSGLPKIGYLYHYPKLDHPTERFRMDIFISSTPTEKHFDVLRAYLPVKSAYDNIEQLKVTHPWSYDRTARVCAGVVILEDRKGHKEEAFTFGGQLKIDEQELQTICTLISPAPILEISGATLIHRTFIEEVEITLAKLRARYSPAEYEKQICKVDPYQLYLACLKELLAEFEDSQQDDETRLELLVYLHTQQHRLASAGLIHEPTPNLEQLFDST